MLSRASIQGHSLAVQAGLQTGHITTIAICQGRTPFGQNARPILYYCEQLKIMGF